MQLLKNARTSDSIRFVEKDIILTCGCMKIIHPRHSKKIHILRACILLLTCGCSLVVEYLPYKQRTGVRFSPPAHSTVRPRCVCIGVLLWYCGGRIERRSGTQCERSDHWEASRGREYLMNKELCNDMNLVTCDRFSPPAHRKNPI